MYDAGKETEITHVPIAFLKNDIARSWSEATGKHIAMTEQPLEANTKFITGSSRDTLLKIMMQESDNFIAEQLLLACSMAKFGYMDEEAIIDDVRHTLLVAVDDYIQWVDGSGLSRYNLVTPASLVDVLQKIYALKGLPYIRAMFPAGGQSGTIKDWYGADRGEPFVFAKSGTLRNQHCLSGYLVTKRGHVLIFSFMHNQFVEAPAMIRSSMENLFDFLYDKY
jgi:D-alanyl-D-alanine carboxypeptidase/D-alanyl-D-alanine-endopeptidase (penicillin-binding protein 4)